MGEQRYHQPIFINAVTSTTELLSATIPVPQDPIVKLLQIRGLLASSYSGTFKYTLIKTDTNYNQDFEISVNADNIYEELNLLCERTDSIVLSTSASAPAGTHYFELFFGTDRV
jgi:hypothetical protein